MNWKHGFCLRWDPLGTQNLFAQWSTIPYILLQQTCLSGDRLKLFPWLSWCRSVTAEPGRLSPTEELGSRWKLSEAMEGLHLQSRDKIHLYGFSRRKGNSVNRVKGYHSGFSASYSWTSIQGKMLEEVFFFFFPSHSCVVWATYWWRRMEDGRALGRKDWFGPLDWYDLCMQDVCRTEGRNLAL